MINQREKIINEMKTDIISIIDKYVSDMDAESDKNKFPIDLMEEMLGKIIADSKKVIVDKTEELINSIDEAKEISKKKQNTKKQKA